MPFAHGSGTIVLLDGANLSGYFRSAEFGVDVDTADTTTFSSSWKTAIPGLAVADFAFEGLYDPTLASIKNLLPSTGSLVAVIPAGGALGRIGNVLNTSYAESAPVGDAVSFTWDVLATGVGGAGQVLHDLTAITADGNGSAIDGGAATTTGAIAQLHALAVSSGDTIDVTVQDSADGATGWATIGTFATVSSASAQRITIAGTIRRYVRAAWNETNDGSPSYTVAVILART